LKEQIETLNKVNDQINENQKLLTNGVGSSIFVIALTKRDKNNLKKSIYEVIINTLLILNAEQRKLSCLNHRKGISSKRLRANNLTFNQCKKFCY
jgi:hypothetical protein